MEQSRIELLQQMPIFGGLRSDIAELLLSLSRTISVRQGDFFFHEGDQGDSLFVLVSGTAAVTKHRDGCAQLLCRLHSGECFGEMALMDLMPRSASVVAVEDCTAIEVPIVSLLRVYEQDVEQFALIEMNMGREVSRRLRLADELLWLAGAGSRNAQQAPGEGS
jgi:CRP-like cAMP-binding protein